MKKIIYAIAFFGLLFGSFSCEYDNYDEPKETLFGTLVNKADGKPFQTETGSNGVRIKMLELSWSDNPTPYYFSCMQDGKFNNTKIFKGEYNIEPIGAFVPFLIKSGTTVITDQTVTQKISGKVELNFEVEPFLTIEWVGEPVINADNTVTATVVVKRGTTNASYQQAVSDLRLFVSDNLYVSNANKISNLGKESSSSNAILGVNTSITTQRALDTNRSYWIRVGSRINTTIDGVQRFNYSTIKEVKMP